MSEYPRVGYDHEAASIRWDNLRNGSTQTVHEAIAELEAELGEPLTLAERREFFDGWRLGKATYALNNLARLIKYANADDMETVSEELYQLARKWGLCRTTAERGARDAHT